MAFRIVSVLKEYEVRAVRTGVSRSTSQPWMQLVVEHPDTADQLTLSVPKDMRRDVEALSLRKGDIVNVSILAVAQDDGNNYCQLNAIPDLCYEED